MANINVLFTALALMLLPTLAQAATAIAEDKSAAVILSYGRVGEDAYPETNIDPDQFQAHLEEILTGDYTIASLPDIIKNLKAGNEIQAGTIAITFEGGYKSAFENAMPLLIQNKIPFTVFYAADKANQNSQQFLNWEDLNFLAKHPGVTLGVLPAAYSPDATRDDINRAIVEHRNHFNHKPELLSYPYGEYTTDLKSIASQSGFTAALTLNSGVLSASSDFMALPRFTMTESYADLDRFRTVTNALPLPATDITPETPLSNETETPGFTITLDLKSDLETSTLSCYISGQNAPEISIIGTRIELRPQSDFDERTRINCTLPGPDDRWRWFGMLLVHEAELNPQPAAPQ